MSFLSVLFSLSVSVGAQPALASDFALPTSADTLKVATYNLENLFDTQHDVDEKGMDKNDAEFLPLNHPHKKTLCRLNQSSYYYQRCLKSDWNADRLQIKLNTIRTALSYQGDLPDLLGVQEIENARVARQLADRLGYTDFVMTDSPDARGIDVALFYRSRLVKFRDVDRLRLTQGSPSRDMLAVTFDVVGGGRLTIVVVHWPSQGNPTAARVHAASVLMTYLKPILLKPNHGVVVMGDFNTTWEDHPNPYHNHLMAGGLVEANAWALKGKHPLKEKMPPSSYWYWKENVWNPFDTFFLSPDLVDGKGLDAQARGYRIVADPRLMKKFGFNKSHPSQFFRGGFLPQVPKRYFHDADTEAQAGFSDHLPVVLTLKVGQPAPRLKVPPAEEKPKVDETDHQ